MNLKLCEHATSHLTIHGPQILWACHMSFNYSLTLNFVNVPCVNIVGVPHVMKPLAKISIYKIVEIATRFLVNIMPHQRMKFIHQLRVINNNFRLYGMHFATKMVSSGYCCDIDMWLTLLIGMSFWLVVFNFFGL
jgi:hypothetical protein